MTAPDITTAQFFAEILHGLDGWAHVFAIGGETGERLTKFRHVSELAELAEIAARLGEHGDVWFGPATRDRDLGPRRRGGVADCVAISSVWLDIDVLGPTHAADDLPPTLADGYALLTDFPLAPSAVVETGGGLQAWHFLAEPLQREQAIPFLTRWGATWAELGRRRGWHIDNVFDMARIMRSPGTWNHKAEPLRPVVLAEMNAKRYTVDDLDQFTIEPPAPPPVGSQPRTGVSRCRETPYIGPERPGDAFNAHVDAGTVVERLGAVFDHESGGDRHYCAPHHVGDRTTGITVYADGHITAFSETFAREHGLKVRHGYDAFGFYVHTMHGGDFRAASDALAALGYGTKHAAPWPSSSTEVATGTPAADRPGDGHTAPDPPRLTAFPVRTIGEMARAVDLLPPPTFLVRGLFVARDYGVLGAERKFGKTHMSTDLAVNVAAGGKFLGAFPCDTPGAVLLFAGEGGERKIVRRTRAVAEFYGLEHDALPLFVYERAPKLGIAEQVARFALTVEQVRPVLIIIDPAYLALTGAETSSLTAMGALLEQAQIVAQEANAGLLMSHHWNKTGAGTGVDRFTGAGFTEWARLLISGSTKSSNTDPITKATTVVARLEIMGDEIAADEITFRRRVWVDDVDDLASAMHYEVAVIENDQATDGLPSGLAAGMAGMAPSVARVLRVLIEAGTWLDHREIGDRLANAGHPLRKRTILEAAKTLEDGGLIDRGESAHNQPDVFSAHLEARNAA